MKPLGRKYYKDKTGGKHHVHIDGKFHCWWDTICQPKKSFEKEQMKQDIEEGKDSYYSGDV